MKTVVFTHSPIRVLGMILVGLMFLVLSATNTFSQTVNWQKTLGGSENDTATAILATTDGGFIVAGNTVSNNGDVSGNHGGSLDMWIAKLNSSGNLVWKKTYGGSKEDHLTGITTSADGGFVFTGYSHSIDGDMSNFHLMYSGNYSYLFVFKINGNGDIVWGQYVDKGRWSMAYGITTDAAGRYQTVGSYFCGGCQTGFDFYSALFDDTGTLIGEGSWPGGFGDDRAVALTNAADGGNLQVGWGNSPAFNASMPSGINQGGYDVWLKRLGLNSYYWLKSFGGSGDDVGFATVALADGGFVVAGSTTSNDGNVSNNHGNKDAWVFKVNAAGSLVWQRALGGSGDDEARAMLLTTSGDIVIVGSTTSTDGDVTGNHGNRDGWVVKLSGNGDLIWKKAIGGTANDGCLAITQSANGQYVVAGYTASNDGDVTTNQGQTDYWVVNLSDPTLLLLAPSYECGTGKLTFNTSGGDGTPVEFMAIGVTPWTTSTTAIIESGVRVDPNTSSVLLMARQSGKVVSRVFDFNTFCNGGNHPPLFNGPLPVQTGQVGLPFSYLLPANAFSDPEGEGLTYMAISLPPGLSLVAGLISGTPIQSGYYLVTISATDPQGASVNGQFSILVAPAETTGNLQLLEPLYNCATGQLTFRTTGGNGMPIEFLGIGITPWTTNPVQFIDQGVRLDPNSQPVTLFARQSGVVVSRSFDYRSFCNQAARTATEPAATLQVRLLGNPTTAQTVLIDITGAGGAPVRVRLLTSQGQPISEQWIEQVAPVQQASIALGRTAGLYIVVVETATQRVSTRLIKY